MKLLTAKKIIALFAIIVVNFTVSFGQIRDHISINGTPSAFLIYDLKSTTPNVGLSIIPEIEYSHDVTKFRKFYLSVQWAGVKQLTNTSLAGDPIQNTTALGYTNIGISAGFSWNLLPLDKNEGNSHITLPVINSFAVGVGIANFLVGTNKNGENIYSLGPTFTFGFKLRALSLNIGESSSGN